MCTVYVCSECMYVCVVCVSMCVLCVPCVSVLCVYCVCIYWGTRVTFTKIYKDVQIHYAVANDYAEK